jgi:hypothetical protein
LGIGIPDRRSKFPRAEGIALAEIAGIEAFAEPAAALFGGAVDKRIGDDAALGLFLQGMIASPSRDEDSISIMTKGSQPQLPVAGMLVPLPRRSVQVVLKNLFRIL